MVGAPFITALCLLRKGVVDKDGNGIADEDEKQPERRPRNDFNDR